MKINSLIRMSATATSTIVVGLNGALQKRFVLSPGNYLIPGNVHRANEVQFGVGGKGQDVAVTLSCLDYTGGLKLAQFVGTGYEGDQVYNMLENILGPEALELTVRPTTSGMRTCTSIVASDTTTELVEPSGTIIDHDMKELFIKLNQLKRQVSAICFMGSMPPGCPETTYADIYEAIANHNTICVIDSVTGLQSLIERIGKLNLGSTILKINASELFRLAGVQQSKSETSGVNVDELTSAIRQFFITYPIATEAFTALAVTDSSHPAHLAEIITTGSEVKQGTVAFQLHQLPIVSLQSLSSDDDIQSSTTIFPIGAGDSVAAGLLAAWKCLLDSNTDEKPSLPNDVSEVISNQNIMNGHNKLLTSFAFGLACGSASCLEEENSVVKRENVMKLFLKSTSIVLDENLVPLN